MHRSSFRDDQDAIWLADGETVRKTPANLAFFKIGPTSTAIRTSSAEQARQLQKNTDGFTVRYAKLKELFNNLRPFVGREQDETHEVLKIIDRIPKRKPLTQHVT